MKIHETDKIKKSKKSLKSIERTSKETWVNNTYFAIESIKANIAFASISIYLVDASAIVKACHTQTIIDI